MIAVLLKHLTGVGGEAKVAEAALLLALPAAFRDERIGIGLFADGNGSGNLDIGDAPVVCQRIVCIVERSPAILITRGVDAVVGRRGPLEGNGFDSPSRRRNRAATKRQGKGELCDFH